MKSFKTLSEFHEFRQLPKPLHPLFSVVDMSDVPLIDDETPVTMILEFYSISIKRMKNVSVKYGQNSFDFDEGILFFIAPNQVFSVALTEEAKPVERSGWVINIHPDFLWNTTLAKTIRNYDFWGYSVNESLFLSEKEELIIHQIVQNILQEYRSNIDKFSKQIIISHIESLLGYADRFYHRQFITREKRNYQLLDRLDQLLADYFDNSDLFNNGLPSVSFVANELNLSPKYLTSMLKMLSGQSTQQYIHNKLIAKAKEMLTTTELSVSEISFLLGFEHIQSFSKLFKAKNNISPVEYRKSFK
ncbi:helix-turn-helix domain-containing protein [Pedobacter sp. KLB.chiD]|uniref:helix-turn-helix domain-containing protein n=1 Tax=Pedobacter sp. KLB.chiD TaxID=3387402 RepID=UPI00399C175A